LASCSGPSPARSCWPSAPRFRRCSRGAQWLATTLFDPLGQVFLRLLFFVVIPLVFASLAHGVLQLGKLSHLGPLAGRTFTLFFANMTIAVVLGVVMMNVLQPGGRLDEETSTRLVQEYSGQAQKHVETSATRPVVTPASIVDMFMPRNLFGAFVGNQRNVLGDVLPLILFAILVGAAGLGLPGERRERCSTASNRSRELMTGIVHFALRLAPYAVPAMIFSVIVKVGFDIVVALGLFVARLPVRAAAAPVRHDVGVAAVPGPAQPAAVLPRHQGRADHGVLDQLEQRHVARRARRRPRAARHLAVDLGFVLPLGATMNMSGTALYEGCVVLFVAQVFGVHLDLAQQLTLVLLSVLSAVAVASIPGGSLPLIAGLLVAFGIPPEGIGIILGVDRILDMTRTMTNVGADLVTAAIVDERRGPHGRAPRARRRPAGPLGTSQIAWVRWPDHCRRR
jgi:dicarboxylate/amino acid:cation (Na+ or H+) symporter, DAACS family